MIDSLFFGEPDQTAEETVRRGPLRRHVLWVVGVTVFAVGLGWATALFRLGPDEYGLPPAAPGSAWPYLAVWGVTGLVVAATLRATAARLPVYAPGRTATVLVAVGTRLALSWRPEAPLLAALVVGALAVAAGWCTVAVRTHSPAARPR
ncbi:hypothetical protein [Streptomyces lavendulocolor]|uniref:hypothetical protein n=1 Tax=Streptomyces lavendulocolor TaxID=67316 RepID=UPI0031CF9028